MLKLTFKKSYKGFQALTLTSHHRFEKKGDILSVYDGTDKLFYSLNDTAYVDKILLSSNEFYFTLISKLYNTEFKLYSLSDGTTLLDIKEIENEKYIYKDAAFTPDNRYLYVLADKDDLSDLKTILIKINLESMEYRVFFIDEKQHFDYLYYLDERFVLVLLSRKGKVSYFLDNKIIKNIKTPNFDKLYFIDQGEIMLLSSKAGFILASSNGKIIRNCDFLLPKEIKETPMLTKQLQLENEIRELSLLPKIKNHSSLGEHYFDLVVSSKDNALFYISRNITDDTYKLYHYSIHSFALKHAYKIKGKAKSIEYKSPYVIIRTDDAVEVYELIHNIKKN